MVRVIRSYIPVALIIILFVGISFVAQTNLHFFEKLRMNTLEGMLLYVLTTIVATVLAPVSSLPLISVATNLWGWIAAGVLSIIGWFIGAAIVFELSRLYGKKLIGRIIDLQSIEAISAKLPQKYTLSFLILLRMSVPVDILSYALGLFTVVDRKTYYISTAIGIIPFAFIFSYFGTVSYQYQIIALGVVMLAICIILSVMRFLRILFK